MNRNGNNRGSGNSYHRGGYGRGYNGGNSYERRNGNDVSENRRGGPWNNNSYRDHGEGEEVNADWQEYQSEYREEDRQENMDDTDEYYDSDENEGEEDHENNKPGDKRKRDQRDEGLEAKKKLACEKIIKRDQMEQQKWENANLPQNLQDFTRKCADGTAIAEMRKVSDKVDAKDHRDAITATLQSTDTEGNIKLIRTLDELTGKIASSRTQAELQEYLETNLTILHLTPLHKHLIIQGSASQIQNYVAANITHLQPIFNNPADLYSLREKLNTPFIRPESIYAQLSNHKKYQLAIVNGGGLTIGDVAVLATQCNNKIEAKQRLNLLLSNCTMVESNYAPQQNTADVFPNFGVNDHKLYDRSQAINSSNIDRFCCEKEKDSPLKTDGPLMTRLIAMDKLLELRLANLAALLKDSLPKYLHNPTFATNVKDAGRLQTEENYQPATIFNILKDSTEETTQLKRRTYIEQQLASQVRGYEVTNDGEYKPRLLSVVIRERVEMAQAILRMGGQIDSYTMTFMKNLCMEIPKRLDPDTKTCKITAIRDKIAKTKFTGNDEALQAIKDIHRFVVDRETSAYYADEMKIDKAHCYHTDVAKAYSALEKATTAVCKQAHLEHLRREARRKENEIIALTRQQNENSSWGYGGEQYGRNEQWHARDMAFISQDEFRSHDMYDERGREYHMGESAEDEARRLLNSISDPERREAVRAAISRIR